MFSNTTTFSMTRDEIIIDALGKVRAIDLESDAPEPYQITRAARALNRIVKRLATPGTLLWVVNEVVVNLAKGKGTYTVGPDGDVATTRPLRVRDPRWRDISTNNDIPVQLKGRADFVALTDKTVLGRPTWVYYDRKIDEGELTVWPVPEDSKGQLRITADIPIQDFNNAGDTVHAPSYVYDYLVYALAADQAPDYGLDVAERNDLRFTAKTLKEDILDFEEEESGFQIVPDTTYMRGP